MPFKDIDIFVAAATAILQGHNPYAIPGLEVFYPLPFYFIFVPFAGLPAPVVHVIWSLLQAVVLVAFLGRRTPFAALSMPVLLTLLLGQVDIIMMALFGLLGSAVGGGVALAFLALKPQLVLLVAPWLLFHWWRNDRRQLVWFFLILGILVLSSLIVQPDWIFNLAARSGERTRAAISSSVWGLAAFLPSPLWLVAAALVSAALIVWAWRKQDLRITAAVGLFISPFIFSYNLLPLLALTKRPRLMIGFTVLSWIAFLISACSLNDAAAALITLWFIYELAHRRKGVQEIRTMMASKANPI